MSKSIRLISSLALLLCGTSAMAQSGPWTVSEARGQVQIRENAATRAAQRGSQIPAGATVTTGANGNAVLVRGREFVTLRRNSQIRIPAAKAERSIVQVVQDWGSALFEIGKQPDPHFGVETPYLAAVVKGTTFTITVAPEGASMQVLEGAVEVATLDGGARDLVMPGAVAMIAADDRLRLVVENGERKIIDSPSRPVAGPAAGGNLQPAAGATAAGGSYGMAQPAAASRIDAVFASGAADLSDLSDGFIAGDTADFAAALVADLATGQEMPDPAPPPPPPPPPEVVVAPETGEPGPEPKPEPGPGAGNGGSGDPDNGHGNDEDGDDEGNPGAGGNNPGSGPPDGEPGDEPADGGDGDRDKGHGNDEDGDDEDNPGAGGNNPGSGPPDGEPGGAPDDGGDGDPDKGHGNDEDGDDEDNPGRGGGKPGSGPPGREPEP